MCRLFSVALLCSSALFGADCRALWSDGRDKLAGGHFQDAVTQLRVASAKCADQPEILLDLARAYLLMEKLVDAENAISGLLSLRPQSSIGLKLKGDIHYLAGRDPEAVKAFQEAIRADPMNEDAVYALGRVYYQQSRPEQAREQFERAIVLNPKSYRAHDNLALSYQALNQDDAALRHFLKALDLVHKDHREYDWVYGNLAEFLIGRGEYNRAFDLAVEASERNPGSGRNCYLVAKALAKLGKSDLSVRWLVRAMELEPGYPEPHYLLAQIYRSQGKAEQSSSEFALFKDLRQKVPARLR